LSGRQALGVFEPTIPGVLEFGPLALFLAAHVANGGVEELHHMELVEGQAGLRELRLHARD